MLERAFSEATLLLLALTLLCLGVNGLGWIRLRPLSRVASGAQASLSAREIEGLRQLTTLIRIEVVYFALLALYTFLYPGVLARGPVLGVVLYHGLGGFLNEWTRATARAAAHVREHPSPSPSFRKRARRALAVIGALDAVEAVILIYIVAALAVAWQRAGS